MKKLILLACSSALVVASCSSGSTTSDYTAFCDLAKEMDTASSGPHGQDPAAITDPELMATAWESIVEVAEKMKTQSPTAIRDDLNKMLDTLFAMNDIFKANNYDLTAMATNEETRNTMDAISGDVEVEKASVRFNAFMEKNCSVS